MRKFVILALAALLVACTGTSEERELRRETSIIIAYELIDDFNADGFDPIQMGRSTLSALKAGCLLLQVYSDKVAEIVNRRKSLEEAIPIEDVRLTIAAACGVIQKAAAEAT